VLTLLTTVLLNKIKTPVSILLNLLYYTKNIRKVKWKTEKFVTDGQLQHAQEDH